MGGDSAYQAWFKAHHTAKFYEVAINHYQDKENKKKIDALVKEALTFYGYKLGNYEFEKDNRRVNVDEEHKIIYPNLSSVKGFGEMVSQSLYELGLKEYKDFSELLESLSNTQINKTVLDKLVKLNYFNKFGEINYLLEIIRLTNIFKNAKEVFQEKMEELGFNLDFILQYGNKTAKKITKLRSEELLQDLINNINILPLTIKEIIDNQKEILGIITHIDEQFLYSVYYVSELEVLKSITKLKLYRIKDGETIELKMWSKIYIKNKFKQSDFLYVEAFEIKPQKIPTDEINPKTGKKIYKAVEGTKEFWLSTYKNITKDFI
jgi:DNA polymerase III alpha subunit